MSQGKRYNRIDSPQTMQIPKEVCNVNGGGGEGLKEERGCCMFKCLFSIKKFGGWGYNKVGECYEC